MSYLDWIGFAAVGLSEMNNPIYLDESKTKHTFKKLPLNKRQTLNRKKSKLAKQSRKKNR